MLKSLTENKLLLTFNLACEEGDHTRMNEILPELHFLDLPALVKA